MYILFEIVFVVFNYYCFEGHRKFSILLLTVLPSWNKVFTYLLTSWCYIFQFLDAQRIHNLTKYLQALHKAQQATEEHTTLLLNCYTKLKDVNKLDEFIMVQSNLS
jgi:hypothetical protein